MSRPRNTRMMDVLAEIRKYRHLHGHAPSVRELATLCGMASTSIVHYYLDRLEADGYIRRTPNISRSIVLVKHGEKSAHIDQRKTNSDSPRQAKAAAARKNRAAGAFDIPQKSKAEIDAENLERAVALGRARDQQCVDRDVIRHAPVRVTGAQKLG